MLVLIVPLVYSQASRFARDIAGLRADVTSSFQQEAAPPHALPAPVTQSGAAPQRNKSSIGWRELKEGWALYHKDAQTLSRSQRFGRLRDSLAGTYIGDSIDAALRYTESDEFGGFLARMARRLALGGWSVVTFVINAVLALTGLIIILLYLVFLLLDFPEYARTWRSFLPPTYREGIVEFLVEFDTALRRYLRGQSVIALLTGGLFALGFTLIGLPMAVPLGLFMGLLNMVPYLQVVGLVPAAMLATMQSIETDRSLAASLLLTLLVFVVVQMIQDWIILPRVMGKATGLRPVLILLGVFVWGKLLGFLGVLLAIPLTCLGIAYYRRYILDRRVYPSAPLQANP